MLLDLNQSISFLRALLGAYRIFRDANIAMSFDDVFKRTTEQFKLERDYLYSLVLKNSVPNSLKAKTRGNKNKKIKTKEAIHNIKIVKNNF